MKIMNSEELNEWCFKRVQILGHRCDGIKGFVGGEEVNVAWKDIVTGETFEVIYSAAKEDE